MSRSSCVPLTGPRVGSALVQLFHARTRALPPHRRRFFVFLHLTMMDFAGDACSALGCAQALGVFLLGNPSKWMPTPSRPRTRFFVLGGVGKPARTLSSSFAASTSRSASASSVSTVA